MGSKFELVEEGDRMWLIEKECKRKRWIGNTTTFHHLYFWWSDSSGKKDFDSSYHEGRLILTHGIPGVEPANILPER